MNAQQRRALVHYALHVEAQISEWRRAEYAKIPNSTTHYVAVVRGIELEEARKRDSYRGCGFSHANYEPWHALVADALWRKNSKIDAMRALRVAYPHTSLLQAKWIIDEVEAYFDHFDPTKVSTLAKFGFSSTLSERDIIDSLKLLQPEWTKDDG